VRRVPFHYLNEHTKPCAANKMSIISLITQLKFYLILMKLKSTHKNKTNTAILKEWIEGEWVK